MKLRKLASLLLILKPPGGNIWKRLRTSDQQFNKNKNILSSWRHLSLSKLARRGGDRKGGSGIEWPGKVRFREPWRLFSHRTKKQCHPRKFHRYLLPPYFQPRGFHSPSRMINKLILWTATDFKLFERAIICNVVHRQGFAMLFTANRELQSLIGELVLDLAVFLVFVALLNSTDLEFVEFSILIVLYSRV